ncbi:hypothetical protein AVEN_129553-1, partial [Araneus ventricosus]
VFTLPLVLVSLVPLLVLLVVVGVVGVVVVVGGGVGELGPVGVGELEKGVPPLALSSSFDRGALLQGPS